MKKIFSCFLMLIFILLLSPRVYALEVSEKDVTIKDGGNADIALYVNTESNITSVEFTLVYSTYDMPAGFTPARGFTDSNPNGIKHTITFNEAKTGKILIGDVNISVKNNPTDKYGTINIHTATAKTESGNTITLENQNINVKVGEPTEEKKEEPKEIDKNMLDKIESKLVTIELKKDTFDYTVTIDKTVNELDLKPIAKDENTKIEISTQEIAKLKDNKITITCKNGDTTQVYNILVKSKRVNTTSTDTTIDKQEFKADKSYKTKWIIVIIPLVIILVISTILNKKK